jgi:hypothetical protein
VNKIICNNSISIENLKTISSSKQASQKAKINTLLLRHFNKITLENSNGDDLYKIISENMILDPVDRSRSEAVIIKKRFKILCITATQN